MYKTKKIYYCKDCGTKITYVSALYGQGRCKSCSKKGNMFSYIDGRFLKNYYCIICGIKICNQTALCGSGKCIRCSQKGKTLSQKTKQKMSISQKGKIRSKITREKMSKRQIGKKNHNYIHGLSNLPYNKEFNFSLKENIRKRDNCACQICGSVEVKYDKRLSIHHIDYNKENCKEDNLISLCTKCHLQTNGNRDYWYAYCTYLMENK